MAKDLLTGLGLIQIGFDAVIEAYNQLEPAFKEEVNYPPFHINRISATKVEVEVDVAGFAQEDITLDLDDMVMKVKVNGKKKHFFEGLSVDDTYMIFLVSRNFHLSKTQVKDGVLFMEFTSNAKAKRDMKVDFKKDIELARASEEVSVAEPTKVVVAVDKESPVPLMVQAPVAPEPSLPTLPVVEEVKPEPVTTISVYAPEPVSEPVETVAVSEAPTPVTSTEAIPLIPEPQENTIVMANAETVLAPTTTVAVPPELSPVVDAVVTTNELINPVSTEPQVHIELVPADAMKQNVEIIAIPTEPEDKADIAVTISPEDKSKLEALGIDVAGTVAAAINIATPNLPSLETAVVEADPVKDVPVEVVSVPEATLDVPSVLNSALVSNESSDGSSSEVLVTDGEHDDPAPGVSVPNDVSLPEAAEPVVPVSVETSNPSDTVSNVVFSSVSVLEVSEIPQETFVVEAVPVQEIATNVPDAVSPEPVQSEPSVAPGNSNDSSTEPTVLDADIPVVEPVLSANQDVVPSEPVPVAAAEQVSSDDVPVSSESPLDPVLEVPSSTISETSSVSEVVVPSSESDDQLPTASVNPDVSSSLPSSIAESISPSQTEMASTEIPVNSSVTSESVLETDTAIPEPILTVDAPASTQSVSVDGDNASSGVPDTIVPEASQTDVPSSEFPVSGTGENLDNKADIVVEHGYDVSANGFVQSPVESLDPTAVLEPALSTHDISSVSDPVLETVASSDDGSISRSEPQTELYQPSVQTPEPSVLDAVPVQPVSIEVSVEATQVLPSDASLIEIAEKKYSPLPESDISESLSNQIGNVETSVIPVSVDNPAEQTIIILDNTSHFDTVSQVSSANAEPSVDSVEPSSPVEPVVVVSTVPVPEESVSDTSVEGIQNMGVHAVENSLSLEPQSNADLSSEVLSSVTPSDHQNNNEKSLENSEVNIQVDSPVAVDIEPSAEDVVSPEIVEVVSSDSEVPLPVQNDVGTETSEHRIPEVSDDTIEAVQPIVSEPSVISPSSAEMSDNAHIASAEVPVPTSELSSTDIGTDVPDVVSTETVSITDVASQASVPVEDVPKPIPDKNDQVSEVVADIVSSLEPVVASEPLPAELPHTTVPVIEQAANTVPHVVPENTIVSFEVPVTPTSNNS